MSKPKSKPKPEVIAVARATRRPAHRSAIPPGLAAAPQRRRDILLAAVEMFSARGYNNVSLRDIAERANVPITLCSYYFGLKHELFRTLFAHSSDQIDARMALLRGFRESASEGPDAIEQLVQRWATPVLDMRATPESAPFAVLIARALWDPAEEAQAPIEEFYDPIAFAFLDALRIALPGRAASDLVWGYEWAVGSLLMHIADRRIERLSKGTAKSGDRAKGEMLIQFICAGLKSLPTTNPQPESKRTRRS